MAQRVVTVCTGNICRSPVAEAVFRAQCSNVIVSSAGLHALVGQGIDPDSRRAAQQYGIALHDHSARQFSAEIGAEADVIIVMEKHHRLEIMQRWPHLLGKTFLLGHFEKAKEIPDPYRQGSFMHLQMAEMILDSVAIWNKQLSEP